MPAGFPPLPDLQVQASSGLSFAWAEYHPEKVRGSSDTSLGPEGVATTMMIIFRWEDLETAITEVLGYTSRVYDEDSGTASLHRYLPWQHPLYNQCFAKSILSIKGYVLQGKEYPGLSEGGFGSGENIQNSGPATSYLFAVMGIGFWRPPYYVRSDDDILDATGEPQEWLRYVDKAWSINTSVYSSPQGQFIWSNAGTSFDGPLDGSGFPSAVGKVVPKMRVTRRWYQIPEACIFTNENDDPSQELPPNGLPKNLIYTQTETTNPITGITYGVGQPIVGCVNSPIGGGIFDEFTTLRMFGCYMGTLLYVSAQIEPMPLHLPPSLMGIPAFAQNEAISQVQYDIVFNFDFFDPPRGEGVEFRGHNLMPFALDALFYAVKSQSDPANTPFSYADFSDLFKVL